MTMDIPFTPLASGGVASSTSIAVLGAVKGAAVQGTNILFSDALITIPAGTLEVGDFLSFDASMRKASAVDGSVTCNLDFLAPGVTAHDQSKSINGGGWIIGTTAGHISGRSSYLCQVTSLTTLDTVGNVAAASYPVTTNSANRTVTVASLDTNDITIATFATTPAVDVELEGLIVTIIRPGGSISAAGQMTGAQIVAALNAQLGSDAWQSGGGVSMYGDLTTGVWAPVPSIFRLRMAGTGTVQVDVRNNALTETVNVVTYTIAGTERIEWQPSWAASDITEIKVTLTGSATAEVI